MGKHKRHRPPVRAPHRQSPWLIVAALVVAVAAVILVVAALGGF